VHKTGSWVLMRMQEISRPWHAKLIAQQQLISCIIIMLIRQISQLLTAWQKATEQARVENDKMTPRSKSLEARYLALNWTKLSPNASSILPLGIQKGDLTQVDFQGLH
jgi:hypothetical protein